MVMLIFLIIFSLANLGLCIANTVMLTRLLSKDEKPKPVNEVPPSAPAEQPIANNFVPPQNSVPQNPVPPMPPQDQYNQSKIGAGVGFAFLGLLGLIIGICLYPERTMARETFMKGWLITFFSLLGAGFVLGLGIYFIILASIPTMIV